MMPAATTVSRNVRPAREPRAGGAAVNPPVEPAAPWAGPLNENTGCGLFPGGGSTGGGRLNPDRRSPARPGGGPAWGGGVGAGAATGADRPRGEGSPGDGMPISVDFAAGAGRRVGAGAAA